MKCAAPAAPAALCTGKKRRGFTLIELIVAIAVIGILSVIAAMNYREVTGGAQLRLFEQNCHAVAGAIGVYQAGHEGETPPDEAELGEYLQGGWDALAGCLEGAEYRYDGAAFTAGYTDWEGEEHTFAYPD